MGNDARQRAWSYPATGNSRLLLLALAEYIQDGKHTCWPAIETLAGMVGIGVRQTQRLLQTLETDGAIVMKVGRGRGHTTLYGLLTGLPTDLQDRVRQHVKHDIAMSPIEHGKGDIKPDIATTPFAEEKVTFRTEKVTSGAIKGDIAMSPRTEREPKERTERGRGATRAPPTDDIAYAHLAVITYQNYFKRWPDIGDARKIAALNPDFDRWSAICELWKANRWDYLKIDNLINRYEKGNSNGTHPPTRHAARNSGPPPERLDGG